MPDQDIALRLLRACAKRPRPMPHVCREVRWEMDISHSHWEHEIRWLRKEGLLVKDEEGFNRVTEAGMAWLAEAAPPAPEGPVAQPRTIVNAAMRESLAPVGWSMPYRPGALRAYTIPSRGVRC